MRGRIVIVGLALVVVAAAAIVYRSAGPRVVDDRPFPAIVVEASSPKATAWEVVAQLAEPIESEIDGVEHLHQMRSECFDGGTYRLSILFRRDTDIAAAQVAVQQRLEAAAKKLPAGVKDSIKVRSDVVAAYAPKRPNTTDDRVPLRFAVQWMREGDEPTDMNLRLKMLRGVTDSLVERLGARYGIIELEASPKNSVEYMRLIFDASRAASLGVTQQRFDDTLRAAFGRTKQVVFSDFKKTSLTMTNESGNAVSLYDFTSYITVAEPAVVERLDRRLMLTVSMQLRPEVSEIEARKKIETQAQHLSDYRLAWIDEPR